MSSGALTLDSGMVPAVDSASVAPQIVWNWQTDAAGINRPRPGLTAYTTAGLGTSPLIGLYVWQTWLIGVTADRKLWSLSQTLPTAWTALSDGTAATQLDGGQRPVFAEDSLRVVIAGGGSLQQWQGVGLSSRLGAGPTCTHVANLGQRLVANNTASTQEFDWSDLGDGLHASWNALSFANADARPDPVVAIYENLRELHVFGTTTTQIYTVGTDPLNPWDNAATANVGCAAPYSVVRLDDTFAFLDNRRRFVTSDGRTINVLSDAISSDLRSMSVVNDCWGYREETANFSLTIWTFPTAGRTFVYDNTRQSWTERKFYQDPFQSPMPQNCYAYWPALNLHLLGSSTTGALYQLDVNSELDLGGPLVCERYTGWNDFGNRMRKRDVELIVTMRRGTVAEGATEPVLEVRCRDDGGAWSDWDYILLGQPEDAEQSIKVFLGGVFRRRLYHFRYSGSSDVALVSAEQFFEQLDMSEAA